MSVLIKGMEMPTSCRDCPCFCEEYFYCRAKEGDDIGLENRPKDCPLFTVPPHGRLIDADAEISFNVTMDSGKCQVALFAETIIEAEVTE